MPDLPPRKQKGDIVEGYKVLDELGQGAASIIYAAQDVKTKQIVAIKHVQRNDPKHQRFLDQAENEYKVSRSLDHPAFRGIHKVIKKGGLLKQARELFLVMELIDGVSMERTPPSTFEQAVHIFGQVAQGLAHMHQAGYVHADMKPNNIVVAGEQARIIDLGQSCRIGTIKERIQGTPDYIAPEQVHRREIVPRTDVYNLGATMYWVLTRQHIPTALPKNPNSLVNSLDDSLIEKPKPANEINSRIGPRLNELIMQCVEVPIDGRPESMDSVSDRLATILGLIRTKGPSAA